MDRFTKIVTLDNRDNNDPINKVAWPAGSAHTDLLVSVTAEGGTPQTVDPAATVKLYVQWDYANKADEDKNKTDYYLEPTTPGYNITIEAGKIRLPLDGNIINKAGIGRLQFEIIETNGDSTDSYTTAADYLVKENPAWDSVQPDPNAPSYIEVLYEEERIKGGPIYNVYDEAAEYTAFVSSVRIGKVNYTAVVYIPAPAGPFDPLKWRVESLKEVQSEVDKITQLSFTSTVERDNYFSDVVNTKKLIPDLLIHMLDENHNNSYDIYRWPTATPAIYDASKWEYGTINPSSGVINLGGNIVIEDNSTGITFKNIVESSFYQTVNSLLDEGATPKYRYRTASPDVVIADKSEDIVNPDWTNSVNLQNETWRSLVLDFTNVADEVILEAYINSTRVQYMKIGSATVGENVITLSPPIDILAGDAIGFKVYSPLGDVTLKGNISDIPYQRATASLFEDKEFVLGAVGGTGKVQYAKDGNFAYDDNFHYDEINEKLGVGTSAPKGTLHASNDRDAAADLSILDNYLAILDNGTQTEGKINGIALTYDNNTVKSALVMESMAGDETRLCLYVDKGAGLERSLVINNADELGEILASGKVALLEGNPIQGDFETRYGFAGEFSSVIDTGDGRATIVLDTGDAVVSTMIVGSRIVISNSTNYNGTYTIYSRDIGNNRITLTTAFSVTDTGSWDSYAAKAFDINGGGTQTWDKWGGTLIQQNYSFEGDVFSEVIRGGQNKIKTTLDSGYSSIFEVGGGGKTLRLGTTHTGNFEILTADLQRLIVSGGDGSFNFLDNQLKNVGGIGINESTAYTTADIRSDQKITDFSNRSEYSMYINKIGPTNTGDYFSSVLFGSDNQRSAALVVQDAGSGNRTRMKFVLDNGVDFDERFVFNYTGDFTASNNIVATEKLLGDDLNVNRATIGSTKKYIFEESDFGALVGGRYQITEGTYDLLGKELILNSAFDLQEDGVITFKNGGIAYTGTEALYNCANYQNTLSLQNVGHKFAGGGEAYNITSISPVPPVIVQNGVVFDFSGPSPSGIGTLTNCYLVSNNARYVNYSEGLQLNNMAGIIVDKVIIFSNSTATKTFFNINGTYAGLVRFNTVIATLDEQDTLFNFDPTTAFLQGVHVSEIFPTFLNDANRDQNIYEAGSFDHTTPGFDFYNNTSLFNSKISANQYIIGNSEDTTIFDAGEYARIASLPQFRGSDVLERFTSSSNGELVYTGITDATIKIETNVTFTTASASTQSITTAVGFTSHIKTLVTSFTPIDDFIITATPHGLSNGDTIRFGTDGTLPTGLFPSIFYYVRNASPNDFQVSTTPAGAIVDFTTAGTGTAHVSEGYIIPQSVVETSTTSSTYKTVHTSALAGIQTGDIIEIFVACLTSSSDIKVKSENTIIY